MLPGERKRCCQVPLTLTLSRQGERETAGTLPSQGKGKLRGRSPARGEGIVLICSVASGNLSMERVCGESTASVLNTGKLKR